jgi:hypothetical protein
MSGIVCYKTLYSEYVCLQRKFWNSGPMQAVTPVNNGKSRFCYFSGAITH